MVQEFQSGARRALIALASVVALAMPGMGRATQLDPEAAMVQEFQSFCVDYYTPAQCTGAVRFILKTTGSQYFVQLHYDGRFSRSARYCSQRRRSPEGERSLGCQGFAHAALRAAAARAAGGRRRRSPSDAPGPYWRLALDADAATAGLQQTGHLVREP
jgi:hypothetical protein